MSNDFQSVKTAALIPICKSELPISNQNWMFTRVLRGQSRVQLWTSTSASRCKQYSILMQFNAYRRDPVGLIVDQGSQTEIFHEALINQREPGSANFASHRSHISRLKRIVGAVTIRGRVRVRSSSRPGMGGPNSTTRLGTDVTY